MIFSLFLKEHLFTLLKVQAIRVGISGSINEVTTEKPKQTTKDEDILDLIFRFGGVDGVHHKQWLLDQIVMELTGDEDSYNKWIEEYENDELGIGTYHWDRGIAP